MSATQSYLVPAPSDDASADAASAPRRRGRPRSVDRDGALDRAVEAFWEAGYDGTSLDDLTAAMNVSRPTLYEAFGGKRDLFLSALDRYACDVGGAAVRAFEAERTPEAAVRAFLRTALHAQTRDDGAWGCLLACAAPASAGPVEGVAERLHAIRTASHGRLREGFERLASDGSGDGSGDGGVADERALRLLDAMNGQALAARSGTSRDALSRMIEARVTGVLGCETVERRGR